MSQTVEEAKVQLRFDARNKIFCFSGKETGESLSFYKRVKNSRRDGAESVAEHIFLSIPDIAL